MSTVQEIEARHSTGVYGKRDLVLVRGQGSRVWDENGRSYIDCIGGIAVANVGHSHPQVVAAIARQAEQLITCQEIFYNPQRAALMERLTAVLPPGLDRLYFCNSGSEAVESALKFARLSTGRPHVVATMRGFHGRSLGALSATFDKKYRQPFMPLVPGFSHVPFDNIERLETAVTDQTAAVILEIVQGEGGVRPGSAAYFQAARRLCDERGALLLVDEVQTGFGRTGRWWASQHMEIVPDLMALGKGMAGGIPMGAVAVGPRGQGFGIGLHGSTFGGNPVACAAALAVLDVLANEGLVGRAAEMGRYFRVQLQTIESPLIREVRGLGLLIGVELKERAMPHVEALMARGILALTAGTTVLRLVPPLVISRQEIDEVVAVVKEILTDKK
ncbi:MAG: acetylornithine/succinylornithine family transaminase [Chloroflexota bacterium]